jgi:hypothetical protein
MKALPLLLLLAVTADAATTFVTPQEGGQVFGPTLLEVATDATDVARVDFSVDGSLAGAARTAPYRIVYDFGDAMRTHTITARVWTAGFQTFEEASVTTAALTANDTLNVDLVEVPVRIHAKRAVTVADLVVRENGIVQNIRDVVRERPPAHFAFVVDRSTSMEGGRLEAALAAVRSALAQLRPGDRATLVTFNHHVAAAQPISPAGSEWPELVPSGGTSLRDALASVLSKERTYAFVITDGGDRNSVLAEEDALQKISGTKSVVHAIVLGSSHTKFLDRAAANTGGSVVTASAGRVGAALSELLADVNSRYTVVYQSTAHTRGWRTIDLRARHRGVDVRSARKGYFAE